MNVTCPECGAVLGASELDVGLKAHCGKCDAVFTVMPPKKFKKLTTYTNGRAVGSLVFGVIALLAGAAAWYILRLPGRAELPFTKYFSLPEDVYLISCAVLGGIAFFSLFLGLFLGFSSFRLIKMRSNETGALAEGSSCDSA